MNLNTIKSKFIEQKSLIDYFFDNLDYHQIDSFCQSIINHKDGIIFFTGMGKSGNISKNISDMLVSIGIRSMFLDPVNALHGDIGVLTDKDVLVLFSKSGQTTELIELLPVAKNKNAHIISIVSNPNGILSKQADQSVYLPLEKELCPFDLAPTTSAIIQLIFGNTIVSGLMNNLTKTEYAMNHPAGRIGKRLLIKVSHVMRKFDSLAICHPNDLLIDKISLMSSKLCGNLLIISPINELLGIFTDGDLRRTLQSKGHNVLTEPISHLMITDPITINQNIMAYDAMKIMENINTDGHRKRVKELPVLDKRTNKLIGLVLLHDLIQYGL